MSHSKDSPSTIRKFKPPSFLGPKDSGFTEWQKKFSILDIEIGCGAGLHPIHYAQDNLNRGIVAIERTKMKFQSFQQRFINHGQLSNLFPVHNDALYWLPQNLQPSIVDSYFLLYPNPYPKQAQSNKRWHYNPIMHWILETLKPNGQIFFATNEKWLMEETLDTMIHQWPTKLVDKVTLDSPSLMPLTHFEKKYLARGQQCFHLVFQKKKTLF